MTRARRAVRRAAAALTALAALAGLAALGAGVPWLMWHVAGWPLPRRLPALAGLEAALAGPETPRAVISLLACAGWAAWAGFACQALAETAWQVRHLTALARARPGALRARAAALAPGRALAALLIGGTILGLLAALRGGAALADPATHSPAAARALDGQHAEAPAPGPPPLPPAALYTVRPGDSLWAIAAERLGDGEAWHELWALNNGRPQPGGGALAVPGLIQPGWILRLPAPPGPPPAPARPPAPRPRPPARHGRHAPPPAPARPADGHRGQGIALPSGGLAGTALALAVTAALALAALHRRRRYRPGQDIHARLDPDLARPLPPVITALRRAAAPPPPDDPLDPYGPVPGEESLAGPVKPAPAQPPANPGDPDGPGQALPGPGARAAPPPAGLIALGIRDGQEAAADPAALGGLGLAGPGAPAAGRAILAALLSRALPGSPHGPAEVIVTADAAARLLPGQGPASLEGRLPGLAVAPDLDAALSLAEEAILRGARAEPQGGGGPAPPALIAIPGRPAAARLRAVLSAGVTGILLGPWPGGATCHVSPGGDAASDNPGLDGARLYTLAPGDASAVLDVLAAARPAPPPRPGPVTMLPGPGTAAPPRRNPGNAVPAPPPAGSRLIRVEILGPVRITVRGQEVAGGLRKARELAAYLAARPDGATSDALTEALWPGSPHGAAQRALALRRLRDQLRAAAGVTEPRIVVLSGGRYRLDPSLAGTDYADFHAAIDDARRAAGDGPRLAALRRAAALYRGPLADGEGYEWAEPLAEAARRRALDAWARIAEILRPDDPDGALAALETALGHDPYNEWLYQEVMHIQAAAGRADAARRTLSLLETRLAEIGAAPGAQTRQVAAAILGPPGRPPAPDDRQRTG